MSFSSLSHLARSNLAGWGVIGVVLVGLAIWFSYGAGQRVGAQWYEFHQEVDASTTWDQIRDQVAVDGAAGHLVIGENRTVFIAGDGRRWHVTDFEDAIDRGQWQALQDAGVVTDGLVRFVTEPARTGSWQVALASQMALSGKAGWALLQMVIVTTLLWLLYQWLVRGQFSGARFNRADQSKRCLRFDDVAGQDGAKFEVSEVVDYLKNPHRYTRTGARPPTGIMLYGPPGNGKTLLAKAIAGEAKATFLEQNASSFVQLYAGAGAMSVRSLFREARKRRPCVIFVDELDAVGGKRGNGSGSGNDERLQTLNALLAELDGFTDNEGVVVVAATNRLEELDEALTRPGRFDRKVMVGLPSRVDRLAILKVHAAKIPRLDVDLERWALQTQGFSGADLANLVNEAAIEAARRDADTVVEADFAKARDRVLMGPANRGQRPSAEENRAIAYHEAGHAVVRTLLGRGRVGRVSILPRGRSLGVTITEVDNEVLLQTREQVHSELVVLMGGRAAESVFCGRVSSGAANDMERASQMARDTLKHYGFGDLGPYVPAHDELLLELERDAARWVQDAYDHAADLMRHHDYALHKIAALLLEQEEIDGNAVESALGVRPKEADVRAA